MNIRDAIHEAIEAYTGKTFADNEISIFPDPAISGVWAVKAHGDQFLLTEVPRTTYGTNAKAALFEIEDVEFTQWPPIMRRDAR